MHEQDERDHFDPRGDREQPESVFTGGYQQQQRGRGGADHRTGDTLRGHKRRLLQAWLHRDDGRDRHPVAVRQVQPERECGGAGYDQGANHRVHDQRPGQPPP